MNFKMVTKEYLSTLEAGTVFHLGNSGSIPSWGVKAVIDKKGYFTVVETTDKWKGWRGISFARLDHVGADLFRLEIPAPTPVLKDKTAKLDW